MTNTNPTDQTNVLHDTSCGHVKQQYELNKCCRRIHSRLEEQEFESLAGI